MFAREVIFLLMIVILIALFSGLVFLIRDGNESKRTVHALMWRIGLSLGLFLFLLLAFSLDWIVPHSL